MPRCTSGARASFCTFVASTTVRCPRASRLAAMKFRTSKPSEVLSSDYCRGLVSDDENNEAATRKCFRAKVLLPEPLGPMRTTMESLGMDICIAAGLLIGWIGGFRRFTEQGAAVLVRIVATFLGEPFRCDLAVVQKPSRIKPTIVARCARVGGSG